MALDKLVDSSQLDCDLGDIAEAIRAKGGTSGQLQFPQGFVDAVEAIETGGADIADWRVVSGTVTTTAISNNVKFNIGITGTNRLIACIGFYAGDIADLPPASDYSETYTEQICGWYSPGHQYMRNGFTTGWSPNSAVFRRRDAGTNSYYQSGTSISLATTGVVTVSTSKEDTAFMPGVTFNWLCVVGVNI